MTKTKQNPTALWVTNPFVKDTIVCYLVIPNSGHNC